MRTPDPRRLERFLGDGDEIVAVVPATPCGALPATVAGIVARSLGLARLPASAPRRWDCTADAFVEPTSVVDPRRRQVLLALTGVTDRLMVIGLDRLGRPAEVLWSTQVTDLAAVSVEPARLLGVATDALVFSAAPGCSRRFVLARPHRRSGRELAARLTRGVRYSDG
jgi:hypothetical protein